MDTPKSNVCGWFEIPVMDMDRAIKFYETIFNFKMHREKVGDLDMGWFPFNMEGYGAPGSLALAPDFYTPSDNGTLVYLSSNSGDIAEEISRVEEAGGKVLIDKKEISPEHGFMGVIMDSEGNRVALHSQK